MLQLAGSQIADIWSKIANGKSKDEVIKEFGKVVFGLAEEPMTDPTKWEKISTAWKKVGHSAI